eukprot:scaffold64115_cov21-Tisochrysis_lutea.AAC.2
MSDGTRMCALIHTPRWDEIKKAQPQIKRDVEPIQASEAERIRNDLVAFGGKAWRQGGLDAVKLIICTATSAKSLDAHTGPMVNAYRGEFRKKPFYRHNCGFETAYNELDGVARGLVTLQADCKRFMELASIFEFPQLVDPISKSLHPTLTPWLHLLTSFNFALTPRQSALSLLPGAASYLDSLAALSLLPGNPESLQNLAMVNGLQSVHDGCTFLCSQAIQESLEDTTIPFA